MRGGVYYIHENSPVQMASMKKVIKSSRSYKKTIVIKSKETRMITYTRSYSSGHLIPNSS